MLSLWQGRVVLRRPRNDKPFIISDMPGKEIIAHEKFMAQLCKANAWLVGSVGLLLLGSQVVQLGRVIWRAKLNWYEVASNATGYMMQTHRIATCMSCESWTPLTCQVCVGYWSWTNFV